MAVYTIHAGHAKSGNPYSGTSGYCQESVENRKIKNYVINYLAAAGHTVYDCTVDSGSSQTAILNAIKSKINTHKGAAANISIHLNAYEQTTSDGATMGVECCVYSDEGQTSQMANKICSEISSLGFKNRGVKERTQLSILKGITNEGINIIVEAFFCDDEDDYNNYLKVGPKAVGKAIAEGILGISVNNTGENTGDSDDFSGNTIIRDGQIHANNFANCGLDADGIRGTKTKKAGVQVLQSALNLDYKPKPKIKVDGIYGKESRKLLDKHYVREGETQYLVTAVEILLMLKGYDPQGVESPGIFSTGLKRAVISYQKAKGLKATGIANTDTIESLIK